MRAACKRLVPTYRGQCYRLAVNGSNYGVLATIRYAKVAVERSSIGAQRSDTRCCLPCHSHIAVTAFGRRHVDWRILQVFELYAVGFHISVNHSHISHLCGKPFFAYTQLVSLGRRIHGLKRKCAVVASGCGIVFISREAHSRTGKRFPIERGNNTAHVIRMQFHHIHVKRHIGTICDAHFSRHSGIILFCNGYSIIAVRNILQLIIAIGIGHSGYVPFHNSHLGPDKRLPFAISHCSADVGTGTAHLQRHRCLVAEIRIAIICRRGVERKFSIAATPVIRTARLGGLIIRISDAVVICPVGEIIDREYGQVLALLEIEFLLQFKFYFVGSGRNIQSAFIHKSHIGLGYPCSGLHHIGICHIHLYRDSRPVGIHRVIDNKVERFHYAILLANLAGSINIERSGIAIIHVKQVIAIVACDIRAYLNEVGTSCGQHLHFNLLRCVVARNFILGIHHFGIHGD